MTQKKKVCIVTSSFPRYESDYAGRFIAGILIQMADKYEIHVIYPSNMALPNSISEPFVRHPIAYPLKIYPMSQVHGLEQTKAILLSLDLLTEINRVVNENNIDLIHSYWAIPSGFLCALNRRLIPKVLTIPGSDINIFAKKFIFKHLIKYSLNKMARTIVVSNDLKREIILLGAEDKEISVIPAGVDIEKFKPMNKSALRSKLGLPQGFLAIFVGSLFPVKNVDMLIKVFNHFKTLINVNLLIIGDGPERTHLENLAKSYDLKNIIFKGRIAYNEMPSFMSSSDVLLLSSISEGLPGCVQEAMACGLPIITTNVGGLSDIVQNGMNGFLINDEHEMEKSLRYIISTPDVLNILGKNALNYAIHNLSIKTISNSIDEIYSSLLLGK